MWGCLITHLSESGLGAALETWALSHSLAGKRQDDDGLRRASPAATPSATQVKNSAYSLCSQT